MKEIYEKGIQPILPKNFDENEWFALVITILISSCVYYITLKNAGSYGRKSSAFRF